MTTRDDNQNIQNNNGLSVSEATLCTICWGLWLGVNTVVHLCVYVFMQIFVILLFYINTYVWLLQFPVSKCVYLWFCYCISRCFDHRITLLHMTSSSPYAFSLHVFLSFCLVFYHYHPSSPFTTSSAQALPPPPSPLSPSLSGWVWSCITVRWHRLTLLYCNLTWLI